MNCVGVCTITSMSSSSITHQPSEPILARTLMRNVDERTKDEFDGYGRREVELLRCLAPAAATAHSVSPPSFQRTLRPASLTNRQPGQREPFREHSSEYSLHLQLDVSSCSWCAVYMPRCTAGGSTQAMTAADLAPTSRKEASPQWTMTNGTHPLPFPPHESACVTNRADLQGGAMPTGTSQSKRLEGSRPLTSVPSRESEPSSLSHLTLASRPLSPSDTPPRHQTHSPTNPQPSKDNR